MAKRKIETIYSGDFVEEQEKQPRPDHIKKHTLDSDEDDSDADERYNVLNENDIEGEEDGVSGLDTDGVKLTPFNMKEELEEGHFDADGHYQWNKDNNIKDNWLDNIDWVKIKQVKDLKKHDDSDDSEGEKTFDVIAAYRRILELMQPKETIKRTLQRLGGKSAKMSSAERWKMKKAGIVDPNAALVTELTELTNEILTQMGNMDIYEETYEMIQAKYGLKSTNPINTSEAASSTATTTTTTGDNSLDMYADDFDTKEKTKLKNTTTPESTITEDASSSVIDEVSWDFKWKPDDTDVHGPFSSAQMKQWVDEGYFKDGVLVRKSGTDNSFNSSNRIDFDLYF